MKAEQAKYIRIDSTDAYSTSIAEFSDKEKLLDDLQHRDMDFVDVYEVSRKLKFTKRPAIVEQESS